MKHQMLNVKQFLGQGLTHTLCNVFLRQLFFLSAAIFLFFSFTFAVNAFSLKYRVFPEVFYYDIIHIVVFSPVVDSAVFYISSVFVLLFPLLSRGWRESWKWKTGVANILLYVCMIFLLIEIFSLFFWLQFPFLGVNELGGFFQRMAVVELQFFYVPAFLVPFLVLFTLFAWLLIPFRLWLKNVRTLILRFAGKGLDLKKALSVNLSFSGFKVLDRRPWSMLFLVVSLLLSVVYGFYAYHSVLFGREQFIGVDTSHYVAFLEDMRRGDVLYALSYAFFNLSDRSLSVSILYCFSIFFGLPSGVVAQFSPLVIGPLVVFATYFFMREAGFSDSVCVISGFFSSFSLIMIMGVYAAFISNMMAWVAFLFFSGFLVKALCSKSWVSCFVAGCALASVLFMHVYMWSLMMFVLVCLGFILFMRYVRGFSSLFRLKLVSAIVASNVITELIRDLVVGVKGSSVKTVVGVAQTGLSLVFIWSIVNSLLQKYLCGFLMSPVMLFLTVIGVLTVVCDVWRKDFCLFIKCWVMAPSVFLIFGNSVVHNRVLYVLPFHILGALGIVVFDCWIRQRFKGVSGKIFAALIVIVFLLVNINYALRVMNTISQYYFK